MGRVVQAWFMTHPASRKKKAEQSSNASVVKWRATLLVYQFPKVPWSFTITFMKKKTPGNEG